MAIDTVETLLTALRRSQLFASEQVDEVARELGPHYDDPHALGTYLVEVDWLTPYQFEMLCQERSNELTLGDYQLLDRLGEGAVGEVFKAWDTREGREIALKVLREDLSAHPGAARQFEREREAVTRLNHPNIIKTFDAPQIGDRIYFAMEFVEGMDLDCFVKTSGPLAVEVACDCIRQVAQGLQHAHQLDLVHRDIKPANLFLINPPSPEANGTRRAFDVTVKIIDWGLARLKLQPGEGPALSEDELEREKGQLIGTADYLAPEQAQDASLVDIRADIYSLGCTLYYLLTGQPPFAGTSLMQKLMQHREAEPPPVRAVRGDVPAEVDAILRRMLAKDPEERFPVPILVAGALRPFSVPRGNAFSPTFRPPPNGEKPPTHSSLSPTRPPTLTPMSGRPSTLVRLRKSSRDGRDGSH
jgi:serine/threonine protein kinase